MDFAEIMQLLASEADRNAVEGMARYGIVTDDALGISVTRLREIAKQVGTDHGLARRLWASGIHEARILAALVDDPERVSEKQAESWVRAVDSWDLCDLLCSNLLDRTPFAWVKASEWPGCDEEFVKRAGFVLMAALAVHDRESGDERFESLLPLIVRESQDPRKYVKKAVSWALRQIGKRNGPLNTKAVRTAEEIGSIDSPTARWISSDALRELTSDKVSEMIERRRAASEARR